MNKKSLLIFFIFILVFPALVSGFSINGWNLYISSESLLNINKIANRSSQYYEALSIFTGYKKWSSNFTLRLNNFFKQSPNTTLDQINTDIYRKSIHYKSKKMNITFGDFYSLLGRGLVLSVLKNDDVLRERTIFGVKSDFSLKKFDLRFLGGVIKDEINLQKWALTGGEVKYNFVKNNRAGFHFSYINDTYSFRELGKRFTYSLSLHGNNIFKHFSYYTEISYLNFIEDNSELGKAVYSNITFNKGHITLSAEYKFYKNFNNEMNNPPIADREDEVSTLMDSEGGRILISYTIFDPEISFFLNFGNYREYNETGTHIFAGITSQDIWDKLSFSISFGIKDIIYPIKKFSADVNYQFSDKLSVEISSKDKRYSDANFTFNERDHSIQISIYPTISLTLLYQYSHNKIMGLNEFLSSSITLFLNNNLQISMTGGNIRGGQVCSGGQCFIMPPFKGFKFSILKIFK